MTTEWRHLAPGETDHERIWGWVLPASVLVVVWLASGPYASLFTCSWKVLSGLPCPTCGATRALLALLAGHPAQALRLHPLVPIGAVAGACYVAYALAVASGHRPRLRLTFGPAERAWLRGVTAVTIAAVWVFLIVDGR